MSLPHMPFFVSDYEADTAHLTLEEDGCYNRLLRLCWRTPNCSIPNDDRWIMRQMRVDKDTYERVVQPILAEFFKLSRNRYYSARQKEIFTEISEKISKKRIAGKKGGLAKARKTNNNTSSTTTDLPEAKSKQTPSKPVASRTRTKTKDNTPLPPEGGPDDLFPEKPKKETPLSILCEVADEETAGGFIEYRKRSRKPLTTHAAKLILAKLKEFPDANASLNQSIERGWTGVFPVKQDSQFSVHPHKDPASSGDGLLRRAMGGER